VVIETHDFFIALILMASNLLLNHIGHIFSLDFDLYFLLLTSPPKNNLFVVFGPHGHTFTFFIYIVVMNCQILADAMSAHRIYSNLLLTYSCMIYLFFFMRMKNKLNLILLRMPNMPPSHQATRLCSNFISQTYRWPQPNII